ncbi:uncharacterized protein B0T15DRAFT_512774 [Chaetomium strumarium]|uniref:Uncharacterized protein n=1 Tax=Chaetomium strumarium TaxID=1170767 RepID=A0AAJ0GR71_9PEZI|nr:hypothetical protein B0T15DRAFT_512774 [Chaetomium strumarium]
MGAPWVLAALAAAAPCEAASVSEDELWDAIQANKDNKTALHTIDAPAWVSAADFRGTMDILQTYVLTLFACIYTALHLNVPPKTDLLSILIMKTKWTFTALLAPEIVLYMAADQLIRALRVRKKLRKLQENSVRVDKTFDFNLRYAFIVMGGVRVPTDETAKFGYPASIEGSRPIQLTEDGVIGLAQRDFWIYVNPKKLLQEQSRAAQTMTCIVRRVYGLPLTLLEVHTMVHVICAVLMYTLWPEKPLDISEAEMVYDSE